MEKSVFHNLQHDRKWNVEIDGIPINIGDGVNQLEIAVVKLFNSINVECSSSHIEAIHRLPSKTEFKPTIVLFENRKIRDAVLKNKSKLKDLASLNLDIAGLYANSKIFIRPSLCAYYKTSQYNCRILKRHGLVKQVRTEDDGSIKIKTLQDEFKNKKHKKQ